MNESFASSEPCISQKKLRSPIFKEKIFGTNLGKLGPNLPKFEVFGQLFKFASLNFSDFAYFNRQT